MNTVTTKSMSQEIPKTLRLANGTVIHIGPDAIPHTGGTASPEDWIKVIGNIIDEGIFRKEDDYTK